jgi:hypothetical protein
MKLSAYETAILNSEMSKTDPIATFWAFTDTKNPNLDQLMGLLAAGVAPEDFSAVCHEFARGVEYVRKEYDTQPAGIIISAQASDPAFERNLHMAELTHQTIASLLKDDYFRARDSDPYLLNSKDMAFVIGVREAYDVYLSIKKPEAFKDMLEKRSSGPSEEYMNHPLRKEKDEAVHQAMIAEHMPERSPLAVGNMNPKVVSEFENVSRWADPYLEERTHLERSYTKTDTNPDHIIQQSELQPRVFVTHGSAVGNGGR